jgi:hypothetical protein
VGDVDLRGRIAADQDDREAGGALPLGGAGVDALFDLLADLRGDGLAVDDLGGHGNRNPLKNEGVIFSRRHSLRQGWGVPRSGSRYTAIAS